MGLLFPGCMLTRNRLDYMYSLHSGYFSCSLTFVFKINFKNCLQMLSTDDERDNYLYVDFFV